MPIRNASAAWDGTLKGGKGRMHTGTGICEAEYTAASRFEASEGSNPEELIGAAHAGCFSMAFALELEQAGYTPEHIETDARVHIDAVDGGFAITQVELQARARVPGISEHVFLERAEAAKEGCPVSKALAGTEITLHAQLLS